MNPYQFTTTQYNPMYQSQSIQYFQPPSQYPQQPLQYQTTTYAIYPNYTPSAPPLYPLDVPQIQTVPGTYTYPHNTIYYYQPNNI